MENTVGFRVKMFRTHKRLTQAAFAAQAGLTQGGLTTIERGVSQPFRSTLAKIQQGFPDLNMTWLEYGTGSMIQRHEQLALDSASSFGDATVAVIENKYLRDIVADLRADKEDQRRRIAYLEEELKKSGGNLNQPGTDRTPIGPWPIAQKRPLEVYSVAR